MAVAVEADVAEPAAAPSPEPRPAVPLRSLLPAQELGSEPASEATCDALADAALAALEPLASPCTSAHDCEVVASVCPLGCFRVVSKLADAAEAQPAVDAYFARCRPCKNTCVEPPQALACAENRCFASP